MLELVVGLGVGVVVGLELGVVVAVVVVMPPKRTNRAKLLGVTDEQYAAMLAAQGGGCAVCGNTPKTRRLHVDHDHRAGRVRGLLCHNCNRALPVWISAERLRALARYLESHARSDSDSMPTMRCDYCGRDGCTEHDDLPAIDPFANV